MNRPVRIFLVLIIVAKVVSMVSFWGMSGACRSTPHERIIFSVGVFGGSISRAWNVPQNKSYSDLLAQRFTNIRITNMGKSYFRHDIEVFSSLMLCPKTHSHASIWS